MTVLLIGSIHDPHISDVNHWLKRLGQPSKVFDPRRWGSLLSAPQLSGNCEDFVDIEGTRYGRADVSAVWVRFKPQRLTERQNPEQANITRFVEAEWNSIIRGLYHFWSDALWINPIYGAGGSKLEQLYIAKECGLRIPETVVTNDPEVVLDLISKHGKIVYKSLTTTDFSEGHWIWTTLLSEENIKPYLENIKRAPGIFQQFISKSHELRVTTVGEALFPVKIITPPQGPGTVDWRLSEPTNAVESTLLDRGISEALLRYNETNGLVFAAHDLIVADDGSHFFLECNRSGQYMWLEERLDLAISECIARTLASAKVSVPDDLGPCANLG